MRLSLYAEPSDAGPNQWVRLIEQTSVHTPTLSSSRAALILENEADGQLHGARQKLRARCRSEENSSGGVAHEGMCVRGRCMRACTPPGCTSSVACAAGVDMDGSGMIGDA